MTDFLRHLSAAWVRPTGRSVRPAFVVAGTAVVGARLVTAAFDDGAVPGVVALVALAVAGGLLVATMRPALATLHGSTPAGERPAMALVAGAVALLGAFVVGAPVLAAFERRIGPTWTVLSLVLVVAVTARQLRSGATAGTAHHERAPVGPVADSAMLECTDLSFGYGRVQVLHGVDFAVDEGEMVALLGVNGAGKSTLLRAISGLGLPSGGSIRFAGEDITYLGAERRLRLGINQIPGGRATFGPLTVTDNLRAYAYSMDVSSTAAALDRAFATFPRLDERRDQLASTLSGGEQQMLALAKAVMLRPRLLLIDELSLGLAPVIVAELLELVRAINDEGTAVVLVEQSVNIALDLAPHAYFMERGAVQFDGASADLLAREDLLRAVFLDGAGGRS